MNLKVIHNLNLLEALCAVKSPSGEERAMKDFILEWAEKNAANWRCQPEIIQGEDFQDCVLLVFGKPKVAAFAHMDTTGFTVRYQNQLLPIGGPEVLPGDILVGHDDLGAIECTADLDVEYRLYYQFGRAIQPGTSLSYKPNFSLKGNYITSPYLDNRAGIYNLLRLAETLQNGILAFSCWEEHGGGSIPYLTKYIYERFAIKRMLISDVTWVTDGVHHGEGVAISMRDRNIPRRSYIDQIIALARENSIKYQLEVEAEGSSDGRELQQSPYPVDWCFVGAPQTDPHSSHEKIHLQDLHHMLELYKVLFEKL